jgi:DNA polymerase delta subunit 1
MKKYRGDIGLLLNKNEQNEKKQEQNVKKRKWKRPDVVKMPSLGESLTFMHMDTTYSTTDFGLAIIELHGITRQGYSVWVNVAGFLPYFYVRTNKDVNLEDFIEKLDEQLVIKLKKDKLMGGKNKYIQKWDICNHLTSILMFKTTKDEGNILKLYLTHPKQIPIAKELCVSGRLGDITYRCLESFEANILFDLRFMVDLKISGCQWITVKDIRISFRTKRSTAQIEVDVLPSDIIPLHLDDIAPIRTLSWDIECITYNQERRFPTADKDPIISIACYVKQQGCETLTVCFCLVPNKGDTVDAIAGVEVLVFHDERELLYNFVSFVGESDPDIITGYNINSFDFGYFMDRWKALSCMGEINFSRLKLHKFLRTKKEFKTRMSGTKINYIMSMPGRISFDLYVWMQREKKFPKYSLNFVAEKILGDKKEDVPYYLINSLYRENSTTRARVNKYCVKDTKLPMNIIEKLLIYVNNVEMCRCVGVPFKWLQDNGQQKKTVSILLRKSQPRNILIPTKSPEKRPYTGAIVVKPERGFYTVPIATLDFSSLYPSIMQAYNLCYSTFFFMKDVEKLGLKKGDYFIPPNTDGSFAFVKKHIRRGILPDMLEDILQRRKIAKNDLERASKEGNEMLAQIFDGRQLCLKITANSVYGFTSANVLSLTFIAESVTAIGRFLLMFTEEGIESRFNTKTPDLYTCLDLGIDPNWDESPIVYFENDAHIIYGDTDSVMINFGNVSMKRAMELAKQASAYMKPMYEPPNNCIFEKCYYPFLLLDKKRYAGLYWTNDRAADRTDYKGIEIVRRDWTTFCTETLKDVLDQLLTYKDKEAAIKRVHRACEDLLQNRVDISKLILTKGFNKQLSDYQAKGKTVPVHIQVVLNALKRDKSTAPCVGDRVSYVIVDLFKKEYKKGTGTKDIKISEHAEDPFYVLENNIPIDAMWYIKKQLMPCFRILYPVICTDKKELDDVYYQNNPEKTQSYRKLFEGNHMLRKVKTYRNATSSNILSFVGRIPKCLVCNGPAKKTNTQSYEPTCGQKDCLESVNVGYYEDKSQQNRKTMLKHQQICITCQGDIPYEEIICENRICKNWFQRYKSKKDYEDSLKKLERFEI